MAASSWVNISGAWHQITQIWVNVSGVWKAVQRAYSNVSGTWELTYVLFSPHTDTFDTPDSSSITIPFGANNVTMYATGGGGGGQDAGQSGGGGGTAIGVYTIDPTEWGNTLTYTVPPGGAFGHFPSGTATDGSAAAIAGIVGLSARDLLASGGQSGASGLGAGGTATGGTTNDTGGNASPTLTGSSFWGAGVSASGGVPNNPGVGGARQSNSVPPGGTSTAGANGRVQFVWS